VKLCGGGFGNGMPWYGITFDSQAEAEKVKEFLEKGIKKTSKVDAKQTDKEKGKKNE
jgi:hypothetical protein